MEIPNRKPDLILPESKVYFEVHYYIEEQIMVISNGKGKIEVTSDIGGRTPLQDIEHMADDKGRCKQSAKLAKDFLFEREIFKWQNTY